MSKSAPSSPRCIIIAGPNGAGKTTFAREFLSKEAGVVHFANPDLIASEAAATRERGPDRRVQDELAAARRQVLKLEQQQQRFLAHFGQGDAKFPWELVERQVQRAEEQKDEQRLRVRELEALLLFRSPRQQSRMHWPKVSAEPSVRVGRPDPDASWGR